MFLPQLLGQLHLRLLQLLPLLRQVEVVRRDREYGRLEGLERSSVLLLVEVDHRPVLLVDELVVAGLRLPRLHGLGDPPFEFEVRGVGAAVDPEICGDFALPELFGGGAGGFALGFGEVGLIGEVVGRVVGLPEGGVAVLVEEELAEVVVLEGELETGGAVVVLGQQAHPEGVDEPLGLQGEFGSHWGAVGPKLEQHFFGIVDAPGHVVRDVQIVFGAVVDSAFAAGDEVDFLDFLQILLRLLHLLEVGGVLLLVDVVGVFIEAELRVQHLLETVGQSQSAYRPHYQYKSTPQPQLPFPLPPTPFPSYIPFMGIQARGSDSCCGWIIFRIHFILMKEYRHSVQEDMVMTSKETYSICQKVFCCKCFHCLQNEVRLTTDIRKQTLQRMIKNFAMDDDDESIEDSIKLMILIYLCLDESIPKKFVHRCQINPDHANDSYRTDLQFYIPQVCNYLVYHNELKPNYLMEAVERGSKLSFYFAHAYYFYINSLEKIVTEDEIQVFKKVSDYKHKFLEEMSRLYEGQMLNSVEFFIGEKIKTVPVKSDIGYLIKMYGSKQVYKESNLTVKATDITLPNYSSHFKGFEEPELYSFRSTINFFEDLFIASEQLKNYENKKEKLKEYLQDINLKLPASVYVPFTKQSTQYYNVLNIVVEQTRIFSTKTRAPFYIALEIYSPIEGYPEVLKQSYKIKLEKPITLKQNLYSESIMPRKYSDEQPHFRKSKSHTKRRDSLQRRNSIEEGPTTATQTEVFGEKNNNFLTNKLIEYTNDMQTQPRLYKKSKKQYEMKNMNTKQMQKKFNDMFGQTEEQMKERIKQISIYKGLHSWKLIHLIVKTGDNLKQEQFALQLIYQFDYIFKLENLPLLLTPYEVLSMGPDCGIIEMVKDSITFDKLKKHLKTDFEKPLTLKEFFETYFTENLPQAKDIFMRSLAAYSLVMYFLQAKDRHNGNILLHQSGKIFHIDFGFFLSNMPGKGVELQKDCPFKLLSEYVDVMDGHESYYFKKFRQYLFQGYKAVRKHQNKILMLVKMMYSSSGMSMPCFEKGQEAIRQIELRFNPQNVQTDAQLNYHCQRLINKSLDNWATKWYDRFQWYAQGIVY